MNPKKKKEIGDGDNPLITWNKWITKRREQTKILKDRTGRPQVDLAMNTLEFKRPKNEREVVIGKAQKVDVKPRVRGSLFFQPPRLTSTGDNVYEVHRPLEDEGNPPVMEHIAVPKYIQRKELGLAGASQKGPTIGIEYQTYMTKREEDLKEKILKVDPYWPDLEDFMVKGHRPKPPPKKPPPLPAINIIEPCYPPIQYLLGVYGLRINDTVLIKEIERQNVSTLYDMQNESWHKNCKSWSYYFNVPVNRAGRASIYLENVGTVAIRYCWKKIREQLPFIPEPFYKQVFFFNKNEDVLSPGERRHIHFTFISDEPGIYKELWELTPVGFTFTDALSDKLSVNLYADSIEPIKLINKRIAKLQEKIDNRAILNLCRGIIEETVTRATIIEPELYPYEHFILEKDLFIMKNPVCFYHQTEVGKMKEIYQQMTGREWDLSIVSWREALISKEYVERMNYFDILKTSYSDLLKPWNEDDDVREEKHRAMKIILSKLADKFDKEYAWLLESDGAVFQNTPYIRLSDKNRNIFYMLMYEHLANTMEVFAGVISSIDMNRWIAFDFCK